MTRPEGSSRLDSFPTSPWTRFWENPRPGARLDPAAARHARPHGPSARPVSQASVAAAVTVGRFDFPAVRIDDLLRDVPGDIIVVVEDRAERAATVGQ